MRRTKKKKKKHLDNFLVFPFQSHFCPSIDPKESMTSNENSRSSSSKQVRLSLTGQSMVTHPSTTTTELLSPNHFDDNTKQRKLDPRPCIECGKILFSDKTHLFHCQTHAKNEKQCWICGVQDDDIKRHIMNEHGNQKITNTGFKVKLKREIGGGDGFTGILVSTL